MPRLEDSIQIAVIEWANYRKDIGPFLFHIRNEGKTTPKAGYLAKRMGKKRGVSDLFLAIPSNNYHGFWIELKAPKTSTRPAGKLSTYQANFLELMTHQGYHCGVFYSAQETIQAIDNYLYGSR